MLEDARHVRGHEDLAVEAGHHPMRLRGLRRRLLLPCPDDHLIDAHRLDRLPRAVRKHAREALLDLLLVEHPEILEEHRRLLHLGELRDLSKILVLRPHGVAVILGPCGCQISPASQQPIGHPVPQDRCEDTTADVRDQRPEEHCR